MLRCSWVTRGSERASTTRWMNRSCLCVTTPKHFNQPNNSSNPSHASKSIKLRWEGKPCRVKGSVSLTSLLEVILLMDNALQTQHYQIIDQLNDNFSNSHPHMQYIKAMLIAKHSIATRAYWNIMAYCYNLSILTFSRQPVRTRGGIGTFSA